MAATLGQGVSPNENWGLLGERKMNAGYTGDHQCPRYPFFRNWWVEDVKAVRCTRKKMTTPFRFDLYCHLEEKKTACNLRSAQQSMCLLSLMVRINLGVNKSKKKF